MIGRPTLHRLLDVCKINLVTAGDHHVVRPTEDDQPPGVEVAPILGVKSAVRDSLSGEIGAQPITREEGRTSDQDPTVVREFDSDALQRLPVIDTTAAGLAHAVRGHDSDPSGSGPLHQTDLSWATADQDRAEAGQGCNHLAVTQRSVELRRNQGDVAPLRQHVGRLLQVPQIGTNRHCTRAAQTRAGEHHQPCDVVRGERQRPVARPAEPAVRRLCGRPDRGARKYDALWCSGRTGRGDHNCRVCSTTG